MLPILNLQFGDLLKFDNPLNNIELLPEEAAVPEATFGDLLELSLGDQPVLELGPGESLPEAGSALPLDAPEQSLPEDLMSEGQGPVPQAASSDVLRSLPEASHPAPVSSATAEARAAVTAESPRAPETSAIAGVVAADVTAAPEAGRAADITPNSAAGSQVPNAQSETLALQTADSGIAGSLPASSVKLDGVVRVEPAQARPGPAPITSVAASASPSPIPADIAATATSAPDLPARDLELQATRVTLPHVDSDSASRMAAKGPVPEAAPVLPAAVDKPSTPATELRSEEIASLVKNTQPSVQATMQTASKPMFAQPAATTPSPGAQNFALDTPVQDMAWGERVGERVLLMASNQLKSAEIRLSPAELGPLRVQVSVDDGAAHVTFSAQQAVTREAIEQALPRLREMFVENGLSLGQTSVGDHGVTQQGNTSRDGHGAQTATAARGDEPAAVDEPDVAPGRPSATNSLVDTYV